MLSIKISGEKGQTMVEYALLLALIALVSVGALSFLSGRGPNPAFFSRVGSALNIP